MPKIIDGKPEQYDPFGKYVGLTFTKWEKGYSQCVLKVNGNLLNPYSSVHGGVTFTMTDSGMGFALFTSLEDGERCSTIETKIVYFKAVKSGTLTCDTRAKAMGTWSISRERSKHN
jgi:acyl-CoA thioesterase